MGSMEVEAFLTYLAVDRNVSASTQNQALSALVFLYRDILDIELSKHMKFTFAKKPAKLPVVLSIYEVDVVLAELRGECIKGLSLSLPPLSLLAFGYTPALLCSSCASL